MQLGLCRSTSSQLPRAPPSSTNKLLRTSRGFSFVKLCHHSASSPSSHSLNATPAFAFSSSTQQSCRLGYYSSSMRTCIIDFRCANDFSAMKSFDCQSASFTAHLNDHPDLHCFVTSRRAIIFLLTLVGVAEIQGNFPLQLRTYPAWSVFPDLSENLPDLRS